MQDVLVALCGLTPQVVTETLWALGQQRPAIVPEKVWIITTRSGREACERLLFGKNGKLASYLREYRPPAEYTMWPKHHRYAEKIRRSAA
jgi:CRISPR-associated protein (TIGR02584 family)